MQFKTLIRPEHLNHNGHLFGGYMLLWVDEYAYIAAMEEFPDARFVTRAMDSVSFTQSVSNGDVNIFHNGMYIKKADERAVLEKS